jgi:hypothetical protein
MIANSYVNYLMGYKLQMPWVIPVDKYAPGLDNASPI